MNKVWLMGAPLRRQVAALLGTGLVAVMGFIGCGKMQPALAGTYVNAAGSEMSEARDTLVVERASAGSGNGFLIHRRTGYRLLAAGRPGPWKYEREEWRAVYDASSGVMTEGRNGKRISFDLEAGLMVVGKRKYERVDR